MHHQRCRTTRSNLPLLLVCFAIIFSAAAGQVSRADDAASGFANPPMLSSRDGQLHVNRTAAPATYTINGHQFQGMLYNRSRSNSIDGEDSTMPLFIEKHALLADYWVSTR